MTPLYSAATLGKENCVRMLLAHEGIDVNIPNESGRTPLYSAAREGHLGCVEMLLVGHAGQLPPPPYLRRRRSRTTHTSRHCGVIEHHCGVIERIVASSGTTVMRDKNSNAMTKTPQSFASPLLFFATQCCCTLATPRAIKWLVPNCWLLVGVETPHA
jgi:hypothetical protein